MLIAIHKRENKGENNQRRVLCLLRNPSTHVAPPTLSIQVDITIRNHHYQLLLDLGSLFLDLHTLVQTTLVQKHYQVEFEMDELLPNTQQQKLQVWVVSLDTGLGMGR